MSDEKTVHFFALIPLHESETQFKLKNGANALTERLMRAGVTHVLDVGRPSVC